MPVEVNTAALEAVLEATKQHIKLREALGLDAQSWIFGEHEPVELETCVFMLQRSLDSKTERERLGSTDSPCSNPASDLFDLQFCPGRKRSAPGPAMDRGVG